MDWVLGKIVDQSDCGASLANTMITDHVFADDAVIFAESLEVLVMALEALYEEARPLELGLLAQDQGHVISHDMTDDDIIKQTTKLLVVGNTLQRIFSYCSREVKMELFRSHCYSIYCNSLWSRFRMATLNRLKVCHNDILKRLLGLPRWCSSSLAFARNGVNNLDVIRRHSVFSLRSRVELSMNSIITSVRQSSAYVCGPIQQRWLGLLLLCRMWGSTVLYIKMSAPSRKGVSSRKGMKLKSLSLQEKVKVLAGMDAGASMRAICAEFDIKSSRFYPLTG
ncbi:hypothetical protein GWK47_027191 [Chionoecetes opilio]|uniref:Uncharacterized protein n=1 Tax=Chionoecetes opilio TaxID=41210 RepID=A0A8J8WNG2_CHIOP|nr:hypothetical protein GWK47_027191 [Chionoecetes opilio]